jgi:type VI protein secretion system component Hcp
MMMTKNLAVLVVALGMAAGPVVAQQLAPTPTPTAALLSYGNPSVPSRSLSPNTCALLTGPGNAAYSGLAVASYSLGGSATVNPTNFNMTGLTMMNLKVTRLTDRCSQPLLTSFLKGTQVPTLVLTAFAQGQGISSPVLTITLTNVVLNGWTIGSSATDMGTETFSFAFANVCVATASTTLDGMAGPVATNCWNTQRNSWSPQ